MNQGTMISIGNWAWGVVSQSDMPSPKGNQTKNHQRVQTPRTTPVSMPIFSLGQLLCSQPDSSKDRTVMGSPQGEGKIGDQLRAN